MDTSPSEDEEVRDCTAVFRKGGKCEGRQETLLIDEVRNIGKCLFVIINKTGLRRMLLPKGTKLPFQNSQGFLTI